MSILSSMVGNKRIALVTGGNRGLGFETCRQLAQLDLTVILTARDITKGKVASKRLSDKGLDVMCYQLDVSDESHINPIANQVESQFGQIDVLVNNAAILYYTWQNASTIL
jgi:NAD(P)-dependent dehydrogenase (short-subunit alcohol dehydrogenase family)